jgi:hypothetical protein
MIQTDNELKSSAKKKLKVMADILIFARNCIDYSSYLNVPDSMEEYSFIIDSPSYSTFKFATQRCAIIELAKLYGNSNNKHNLKSFLNELINGNYGAEFKNSNELKKWVKYFSDVDPTVEKCIGLRNKAYAHTDYLHEIEALKEVYYADVHTLVDTAERFIKFIYKEFFKKPFSINSNTIELKKNVWIILKAKLDEEF